MLVEQFSASLHGRWCTCGRAWQCGRSATSESWGASLWCSSIGFCSSPGCPTPRAPSGRMAASRKLRNVSRALRTDICTRCTLSHCQMSRYAGPLTCPSTCPSPPPPSPPPALPDNLHYTDGRSGHRNGSDSIGAGCSKACTEVGMATYRACSQQRAHIATVLLWQWRSQNAVFSSERGVHPWIDQFSINDTRLYSITFFFHEPVKQLHILRISKSAMYMIAPIPLMVHINTPSPTHSHF